jgi:hypothetical protein
VEFFKVMMRTPFLISIPNPDAFRTLLKLLSIAPPSSLGIPVADLSFDSSSQRQRPAMSFDLRALLSFSKISGPTTTAGKPHCRLTDDLEK